VREVLSAGDTFGQQPATGEKVLVEFVSANPTGPLHVGHGRQAALGDAICNLRASQGESVWREYYYNDAGVQIQTLANSTQLRARGFKPGDAEWPSGEKAPAYNGDYIAEIAEDFKAKKTVKSEDREVTATGDIEDIDAIREFAVAYLRREQDLDLQAFRVHFDQYYLESSLYTSGRVEAAVQKARGRRQDLRTRRGAVAEVDRLRRRQRPRHEEAGRHVHLLRTRRGVHIAKWERGFHKVINIQGTDHHGTIARVRAGLQAAGEGIPEGYPDYVLHTMVRVMKGGEEVKISKRAGSYVTLRDLIEWTSTRRHPLLPAQPQARHRNTPSTSTLP
jgi:arginyl-tRNA synthetase